MCVRQESHVLSLSVNRHPKNLLHTLALDAGKEDRAALALPCIHASMQRSILSLPPTILVLDHKAIYPFMR